jgi:hypothetical protein
MGFSLASLMRSLRPECATLAPICRSKQAIILSRAVRSCLGRACRRIQLSRL